MAKAFDETAVAAVPAMDLKNMEVIQGGLESFFPVIEMYMGRLAEDLPVHERKLQQQAPASEIRAKLDA
ncbi:hypothetical protein D3C73_709740 [compost metagenome]